MNTNKSRRTTSSGARSIQPKSNALDSHSNNTQSVQRTYERYLALARAEALTGNMSGAQNYYQHAEHYFRSMADNSN
jgi:hypothetical protein